MKTSRYTVFEKKQPYVFPTWNASSLSSVIPCLLISLPILGLLVLFPCWAPPPVPDLDVLSVELSTYYTSSPQKKHNI